MNDIVFFTLLIIFIIMLIRKEAVSLFIFDKLGINVQAQTILYTSVILIVALMTYGILFDDTKEKYSDISAGYNQMRPNAPGNESSQKPHRWFDIDFDSIFPWN